MVIMVHLTEREREVLTLVAEGWTQEAIGDHLVITHRTVKAHIENSSCKLGAKNSAHAVALALVQRAISPDLG